MPQPISVLRTGTGWTIDVTALNLSANISFKDFLIQHAGVRQSNGIYQKTSPTLLTYTGPSLPTNTAVVVYRDSNITIDAYAFGSINSSTEGNNRFSGVSRALEDFRIFLDAITVSTTPATNDPFSPAWDGDTFNAPTRNAVYDYLITLATLASPVFTGTPQVPTANPGTNTTQIASTAFVSAALTAANLSQYLTTTAAAGTYVSNSSLSSTLANYATIVAVNSALTSYLTAATAALTYAPLANANLTGNPTAPTQALGTNSTALANTQFVNRSMRPAFSVHRATDQLNLNNDQKILWSNEDYDTDNAFDLPNQRFVVPAGFAGYYQFYGNVTMSPTTATSMPIAVLVRLNGGAWRRAAQVQTIAAAVDYGLSFCYTMSLAVGDIVELFVTDFGVAGTDINVKGAFGLTWWQGHRLGA